jgi:integrase
MKTHHADNVRIKHKYLGYLKEAKGHAEASLDSVAQALDRFENYTHFRDFKAFHPEQAKAFKVHLTAQVSSRSGERLTQATLNSTLRHLRAFFHWLAGQPGYRSKLTYADADYFNLPANDARIAKTRRAPPVPTLEQIIHVLATMPSATDVELRNRALVAFAILTGARDGALASLKLKHVDLEQGHVFQDGRNVATKRGKSINTWFFPVGEQPLRIVTDWIAHLRGALLWGNDDPLFPKTRVGVGGTGSFVVLGLERACWSSANPIREIFREAFVLAGLPYFNPHSFRNTLAQLGERRCANAEAFKSWSQNLGHDGVLTTFTSYGAVEPERQAEIIRSMCQPRPVTDDLASRIAAALNRRVSSNQRSPADGGTI